MTNVKCGGVQRSSRTRRTTAGPRSRDKLRVVMAAGRGCGNRRPWWTAAAPVAACLCRSSCRSNRQKRHGIVVGVDDDGRHITSLAWNVCTARLNRKLERWKGEARRGGVIWQGLYV